MQSGVAVDESSGIVFDTTTNKRFNGDTLPYAKQYIVDQVAKGKSLAAIDILGQEDMPEPHEVFTMLGEDPDFAKKFQKAEFIRCRVLNELYHAEVDKYKSNPSQDAKNVYEALQKLIENQKKFLDAQDAHVSLFVTNLGLFEDGE